MALEQTQANEHRTAEAARLAHAATREIGGDPANTVIAVFDQATADGDLTRAEAFAIARAIDNLSATERQDFYRAFSERYGDGGNGTARDQALLYDALGERERGPGGHETFEHLRSEYAQHVAEHASKEARVAFVQGVADDAAGQIRFAGSDGMTTADYAAQDIGQVLLSLDGERYALRQAYDALTQASGAYEAKHPALTNVMRVAAGAPDGISKDETVIGDLIANFRETLGAEEQDVFRKAGVFVAATRALENETQWVSGEGVATAPVEGALEELATMVGQEGPAFVHRLEASYGQSFQEGGLKQFFQIAIRQGSDSALQNAGAVLAAVRAPVDAFIGELQRIHDERADIDNAEALLEEAHYVIDRDMNPESGHQWHSEFFHSLYESGAVDSLKWAATQLAAAVDGMNDRVADNAGFSNRVAGVLNFSGQYLLPKNPGAAIALDLSALAFQEVTKATTDRVQAHNNKTAAELADPVDMLRNPGIDRDDPPPLNPEGQTETEAGDSDPENDIKPDPIAHKVFQLLDELKNDYEDARK